jgi:predicted Rossmann-fold nucleotide-binding protein
LGADYWAPLLEFLRGSLLKNEAIGAPDLDQLLLTDSPTEAVEFIQRKVTEGFGLRLVRKRPRKLLLERGV